MPGPVFCDKFFLTLKWRLFTQRRKEGKGAKARATNLCAFAFFASLREQDPYNLSPFFVDSAN